MVGSTLRWFARPTVGRRGWPTYLVCGVVGFAAALALAMVLARNGRLGARAALTLALAPAASFPISWKLSSILLGRHRIVFYEKAAAALACTALVLLATGQPVAPVLDVAMLGIGAFLAVGRIGCLGAGCCHGRRARVGVRYRWAHAAWGYPARWVGLPVLPVQLLDGAASALATVLGALVALTPHRDGSPLVTYVCAYGAARFALEPLRGDDARRYFAGLSEAQWIATASTLAAAAYHPSVGSLAVAVALALTTAALVAARRAGRLPGIWLFSAAHLAEIDRVLSALQVDGPPATTTEGVSLSLARRADRCFELRLSQRERLLGGRLMCALGHQLGRDWTVVDSADGDLPRLIILRQVPPESVTLV